MLRAVRLSASFLALASAGIPAWAACGVNAQFDRSAAFGAAADAHYVCAGPATINGGGAVAGSAVFDWAERDLHARATANLGTGVLTAWAGAAAATNSYLYAASTLWDTFLFNGLAAGGSTLTASLYLSGSMTGAAASGNAIFTVGTNNSAQYVKFAAGAPIPPSVSFSFTAFNGVPIKLGAELEVYLNGTSPGTADLEDPPTFSVVVPQGVSFTSASGVFSNVGTSPVPEASTSGLMLTGLGLLAGLAGVQRRRDTRPMPRTAGSKPA